MIAFNTAQAYIRAGIYKTILVVGAESMSRLVDWSDRSTSVLFGDGAGALILKAEEGDHYWQTGHSDGTKDFAGKRKVIKQEFAWMGRKYLNLRSEKYRS